MASINVLMNALRANGLSTSGNKHQMLQRLLTGQGDKRKSKVGTRFEPTVIDNGCDDDDDAFATFSAKAVQRGKRPAAGRDLCEPQLVRSFDKFRDHRADWLVETFAHASASLEQRGHVGSRELMSLIAGCGKLLINFDDC